MNKEQEEMFERFIFVVLFLFVLSFPFLFMSSSITGMIPHEQYEDFASHEGRLNLSSQTFFDDVIFATAYYSVNGSSWLPLYLSGEQYLRSSSWIANNASFSLPADFVMRGEHYLLFYSCAGANPWDCHPRNADSEDGFWQLHVINNSVFDNVALFADGPNMLPTSINEPPALDDILISPPLPHESLPSFASTGSRVYSGDGLLASIVDLLTYKHAYYSDDGLTWQNLTLQGTIYDDNPDWIRGDAVFVYPESFFDPGDHYVAMYSCDRSFTWMTDEPWDCHGAWQVIVVNGGETDAADPYANVHLTDNIKNCAGNHYDYQCGTIDLCGKTYTYDDCAAGYDCVDNLCIARSDLSCDGVVCAADEYCARGVCLQSVPNSTYFVATWGDDANSGTFDEPFYTWQRGVEELHPGDIVYIRGGVWYPTEYLYNSATIGMLLGPGGYANLRNGTRNNPLMVFNYPGEKPIIDGSLANVSDSRWLSGIGIGGEHIYLRGLTLRHVHQIIPDFTHVKSYSEVSGIGSSGASHRFENVVVHDIDGRGFQHWSYAWRDEDAQYSYDRCIERETEDPDGDPAECEYQTPLFENDTTSWINCDAFNLFSRYESQPGNAADGWKVGTYYGSTFTWEGCRAWNYSDDGFDPHGSGLRIFDTSWASSMNNFAGLTPMYGTEGNGFKTTGPEGISIPSDEHNVMYKNCIAADSYGHGSGSGFIANLVTSDEYPSNPLVINTLSYKNGYGYWDLDGGTVRNNIAYATRNIGPIGEVVSITGSRDYFASNNTWYPSSSDGWPPQYPNPAYNVTDDDFVSLDVTELTRPRKPDGSLPDIEFGHLAEGSDLIDGGVVVPGYHCDTNGSHPGLDCVEWFGYAPDLGPFESSFSRAPPLEENCSDGILNNDELFTDCGGQNCLACECTGDVTESCAIENGVGERTRQCEDGNFLTWSDCTFSCNTGYELVGDVCVASPPLVTGAIIVDHTSTNINDIPLSCIQKAKDELHIAYSHTSHGSQIYDGLRAVALFNSTFAQSFSGGATELHFEDYYGYGDQSGFATGYCYDLSACDNGADGLLLPTRTFLDGPNGQDINVIMWSWCSISDHNIPFYLSTMETAILEYENGKASVHDLPVKFVFMTGHTEGSGLTGGPHIANTQIRNFIYNSSPDAFCASHECYLFDFADIEEYDPDNNYYGDLFINENLAYSGGNWGDEYLAAYPVGSHADITALLPGCSHSSSPYGANLNCALKGQAAWHLFARMVGWDGNPASECS